MTDSSQPSLAPDPKPNSSRRNSTPRRERKEKLLNDYPSFIRPTKNPLSTDSGKTLHQFSSRAQALDRLGLVEKDLAGVPRITPKVREAVGTVADAITLLEGDDNPDSITFLAKWNSLSAKDQGVLHLEDVIIAAGLTCRRFMELLAGATYENGEMMTGFYKAQHKLKVLKSAVKAATDEIPILDKEGEVVGVANGDVKAMELFFKITGDIKPSGGVVVNSNNQTANINTNPEHTPLQSMDSWLIELDEVRKPKQLGAGATVPMIPVERPENAPEIEYLGVED